MAEPVTLLGPMNPIEIFLISFGLGLSVGLMVGAASYLFLRDELESRWLADMRRSWLAGRDGKDPTERLS